MIEAATFTLIGGPTVLIEVAGFRLLTDPTFDPPGEYPLPHVTLRKTSAAKTRGRPRLLVLEPGLATRIPLVG